jgi:hypothetical protein
LRQRRFVFRLYIGDGFRFVAPRKDCHSCEAGCYRNHIPQIESVSTHLKKIKVNYYCELKNVQTQKGLAPPKKRNKSFVFWDILYVFST